MQNNPQSVQEVKEAMDAWAKALYAKDLEAMHEGYASEYRLFDVMATVDSVEGAKELWKQCFPYFDKPEVEYKELVIQATDDMALVHFKSRIKGMVSPPPEEMANTWLRGTVGYRKIGGQWKCIHEHISFPVNCETGQIAAEAA
jgi:ketosteroid isomerase-like protein